MRQSELFTKVFRTDPKDEVALNARLLVRGGFIFKVLSGVYAYLPLGLRVLTKINSIVREEMDAVGGQELHLSVLQDREVWDATGRWESAKDVMYQFKDHRMKEVGLGWTHEEPIVEIARHYINSYKDLPKAVYQIQTKFRNEPRAKSGLIRGREFLMKDLYSFHSSEEDLNRYYEKVARAYERIFKRTGVKALRTVASGGLFSKYSDEFQVICPAGEDTIFVCSRCSYAANAEVVERLELKGKCPNCGGDIEQTKSIEVGNIFKLGTTFSEKLGLRFRDREGKEHPVIMASYGIGPTRLMATIVEMHHDEKGIIWPETVSPYRAHLLELARGSGVKVYRDLQKRGIEVLYDERDLSAGEKFADADLIGIPWRIVVSRETGDKVEVKHRAKKDTKLMTLNEALTILNSSAKSGNV